MKRTDGVWIAMTPKTETYFTLQTVDQLNLLSPIDCAVNAMAHS